MSKRIFTCVGVIQREKGTSASGSAIAMPASSATSRTRGRAQRRLALAVLRVDRAAGEDPRAAHEARRRVALDEQHLERRRAAAQDDHARRQPRRR